MVRVTFSAPDPDPEQQARMKELLDEALRQKAEQDEAKVKRAFWDSVTSQIVQAPSTREINEGNSKPLSSWISVSGAHSGDGGFVTTSDQTFTWDEMAKASKKAGEAMQKMGQTYQEALDRASKIMHSGKTPGHKITCLYDGSADYACTCQPPTAWGRVLLWHCDCCGHPESPMQYGLCDLCHAHQYDPPAKAQADHEAARLG